MGLALLQVNQTELMQLDMEGMSQVGQEGQGGWDSQRHLGRGRPPERQKGLAMRAEMSLSILLLSHGLCSLRPSCRTKAGSEEQPGPSGVEGKWWKA